MDFIYVSWGDYDGPRFEQFPNTPDGIKEAEELIKKVFRAKSMDDYGTYLGKVIQGKEIEVKEVSVVQDVKLML